MLLCTERSTFRLLYNTFLAMSNLIKLHVPFRLKWVWHPCAGLKAKLKNMISSLRNHHFCKLLDLKKRECNWLYLYLTLSIPLYYNTVLGGFWNLRAFSVVLTSALFYCLSSLYAFLSSLCSLLLLRRLVGAGCSLAADHCAVNICSRVFTLTRTNVVMERMLLQWYIYNR